MWTCLDCGEAENENHYKFCYTCGAPKPASDGEARGEGVEVLPRAAEPPLEVTDGEGPAPEGREHGFRLPDALASLGQRLRRAAAPAGDQIISARVSHEAQEAVELLLQAGRFDTKEAAAGFLLEEGARAQAALLQIIREKLSEIERLRAELRGIGGSGG